jgi:hypothetical protein
MKFNLYISSSSGKFNILDINNAELDKVIDCYKFGKESVFIQGKKYWFEDLFEIQIYTFESSKIANKRELLDFCLKHNLFLNGFGGITKWIPRKVLNKLGKRVTDEYIKDAFGYLKDSLDDSQVGDMFVDVTRISEIESIDNQEFDFTKLITFLKELNIAYSHHLFLTVPLLIRAIIDHTPPVFNKTNFTEVSGSHGSKSFKESMVHLDKSSRKIADSFLHTQIRNKEALPNKTQINFKQDLDVLLQEIVRLNKK